MRAVRLRSVALVRNHARAIAAMRDPAHRGTLLVGDRARSGSWENHTTILQDDALGYQSDAQELVLRVRRVMQALLAGKRSHGVRVSGADPSV
jgi:hypothetical protein